MEKDYVIRKIAEEIFESEIMRCLLELFLLDQTQHLSKQGFSLASMGMKLVVEKGIPLPWEPDWQEYVSNFQRDEK